MNLTYASLSHIGLKRETNEDRCYPDQNYPDPSLTLDLLRQKGHLFLVADGMGGMAAGEVASQTALDTIIKEFYGMSDQVSQRESLILAVKSANFQIFNVASGSESLTGMGTTATAMVAKDGRADIVHVGDSRAYLYREGRLRQLTDDHSWVAQQVKAGILTAAQALTHPSRHVIVRALGIQPHVEVDSVTLSLQPGDTLLLCTDGLTNHVPDRQIADVISADVSPKAICETLIAEANEGGGEDNITVVVIHCEPVAPRRKGGKTEKIPALRPFWHRLLKLPSVIPARGRGPVKT